MQLIVTETLTSIVLPGGKEIDVSGINTSIHVGEKILLGSVEYLVCYVTHSFDDFQGESIHSIRIFIK